MTGRGAWLSVLSVVAVHGFLGSGCGSGREPGDAGRGRMIYESGRAGDGSAPLVRVMGMSPVPASRYPCALCHGTDGLGGKEAGLRVPALRWERLALPRLPGSGAGRARPGYTEKTLARAVREGEDAAGQRLHRVMPRYEMSARDMADLVAYLRQMGEEAAPGTTGTTIRVGVLLPLHGPWAAEARAVAAVLEGYAAQQNRGGGIHGRRIELVLGDPGATDASALAAAGELLARGRGVFCFVAGAGPGAGRAVREFLNERGVPFIGPLGFVADSEDRGLVYHVLPSLADQARAGAMFLARQKREFSIGLMAGGRAEDAAMARAFVREAGRAGLPVHEEPDSGAGLGRLRARKVTTLVYFGEGRVLDQLMDTAAALGWHPEVMAASVLLGGAFEYRPDLLLMPFGTGFSGSGGHGGISVAEGAAGEPAVGAESGNAGGGRVMPMAAFAAARVLGAALRAAGRELSRETFVAALSGLRELESGVTPFIGFDRVHRHGVRGALVVSRGQGGVRADWVAVTDRP